MYFGRKSRGRKSSKRGRRSRRGRKSYKGSKPVSIKRTQTPMEKFLELEKEYKKLCAGYFRDSDVAYCKQLKKRLTNAEDALSVFDVKVKRTTLRDRQRKTRRLSGALGLGTGIGLGTLAAVAGRGRARYDLV